MVFPLYAHLQCCGNALKLSIALWRDHTNQLGSGTQKQVVFIHAPDVPLNHLLCAINRTQRRHVLCILGVICAACKDPARDQDIHVQFPAAFCECSIDIFRVAVKPLVQIAVAHIFSSQPLVCAVCF